jgi:asparagine synthase (glutamine-hydrolysing)
MPGRSELPPVRAEYVNINCARVYPRLGERRGYKHDRAYGAWGLEARSPFHDVEFARTAFTITDRLKIRGRTNKYVLRKALAMVVPEQFRRVPKFPQRMKYDLEFAEALDAVAASALSDEAVRRRGLFEPEGIRRLFRPRQDQPYSAEAAMRLWTAVLTEYWAQEFVDRPGRSGSQPDMMPALAAAPSISVRNARGPSR